MIDYKFKFSNNIIVNLAAFMVGLFVTMPIIGLNLSTNYVSLFTLALIFFIVILTIKNISALGLMIFNKQSIYLLLWMLMSLVASLYGLLYFYDKENVQLEIIKYIYKIIIFIYLSILLNKYNENNIYKLFIYGFYVGCIINIFWVILQAIYFLKYNLSINVILFPNFASTLVRDFILVKETGLRLSGLNYDPAHIGAIFPIVLALSLYYKNYFLIIFSMIALAFSQSTTALVVAFIIIIINYNKIFKKYNVNNLMFLIILFFLFIILYNNIESLNTNINGFINRVINIHLSNDLKAYDNRRYIYNLKFFESIYYNWEKIILGTGFFTASYAYSYLNNDPFINIFVDAPYDPENTYISYFYDCGIFGFIFFIIFIISLFVKYRKKEETFVNNVTYYSINSIMLSFIFYHYTLTAYQMLIFIFASAYYCRD